MQDKIKNLSIFIPMYNEEANADRAVSSAIEFLQGLTDDYELIIVDDGSTDNTGSILDGWAERDKKLKVIHLPINTRYAGAFKAGLYACTKDIVFYTDGDNPIDFNDLKCAIPLLQNADVIVGYRLRRQEGLRRDIYTVGYNLFVHFFFGLSLHDVNFAFKLMEREAVRGIRLTSRGSFIDAELLYRIKMGGFRIKEVGIKYFPRTFGVSTLANMRIALNILKEAGIFWLKFVRRFYLFNIKR